MWREYRLVGKFRSRTRSLVCKLIRKMVKREKSFQVIEDKIVIAIFRKFFERLNDYKITTF